MFSHEVWPRSTRARILSQVETLVPGEQGVTRAIVRNGPAGGSGGRSTRPTVETRPTDSASLEAAPAAGGNGIVSAASSLSAALPSPGAPLGLEDPSGRRLTYLRVSITDRCNYRCTYCMPEDGVDHTRKEDVLSFEEIAALVQVFVALGLRRVRLTGGEPTVRKDLLTLVAMVAAIPGLEDLALSTNGHRLAELAEPLSRAGVRRLNVSLDSLDPDKFARITRRGVLAEVLAGLSAARNAGFAQIKLNAVAIKGFNDDEVASLCAFAWEQGFVPRFIEQMPMGEGALYVPGALMSAAEIRHALLAAHPGASLIADEAHDVRGGGPARYLRLEADDWAGPPRRVGIISPITEHFCDTCNRVRLSSAGTLATCLAHDGGADLREPLRRGGPDAVAAAIRQAVAVKPPSHLFQVGGTGGPRKLMVHIGG